MKAILRINPYVLEDTVCSQHNMFLTNILFKNENLESTFNLTELVGRPKATDLTRKTLQQLPSIVID